MQRTEPGGIVIACDFCGTDWDEIIPMIEGHHGSIVCLDCLKRAVPEQAASDSAFDCTMCLRTLPPNTSFWKHPQPPATANQLAKICDDCIEQAAKAFDRDPDVDWKR